MAAPLAAPLLFTKMTDLQLQEWVERNPTRVNGLDSDENALLAIAAKRCSTPFVIWLVDGKGADVNRRTSGAENPLHRAALPATMSFLISRGTDPVALDYDGWTPLMQQSLIGRQRGGVARLLEEPRVVAAIDVKSTREYKDWAAGSTALHILSGGPGASFARRTRIMKLLLEAGANPTLLDEDGKTPLDILREQEPPNTEAIAVLERALAETQRISLLSKSRHLMDVLNVMNKTAKKAGNTEEQKRTACLSKVPPYLAHRVRSSMSLPEVSLASKGRPWQTMTVTPSALLQFVLRAEELGEKGGMSSDVFVELMNMMVPPWYRDSKEYEEAEGQAGQG